MKVVLKQDVKGLGKKFQIIEVSEGYARNFLFPKKIAVIADNKNLNEAQGKIDAAKQAAIEAAATDATQKANTAEQNAKTYADGLKDTIDESIALKADKTTVTALEGKVTAAEGEIDTLQGEIATKAEQSEVDAVNSRIDNLDNNDAEIDGQFVVSTVQTDGLVAVTRKKVNIAKLEQTNGEYIIFNCGNASTNV